MSIVWDDRSKLAFPSGFIVLKTKQTTKTNSPNAQKIKQ